MNAHRSSGDATYERRKQSARNVSGHEMVTQDAPPRPSPRIKCPCIADVQKNGGYQADCGKRSAEDRASKNGH